MTADDRLTEETAARILALVGKYEVAVVDTADELHTGTTSSWQKAQRRQTAAHKELSEFVCGLVDWRAVTAAKVQEVARRGVPASGEAR